AGGDEGETRAFGLPWEARFSRFEETLNIVCPLLREGHVGFAGSYYQTGDCELRPRGPRPPGPPIIIGSEHPGARLLHLAAQYADLMNIWRGFGRSAPEEIALTQANFDAACTQIGRDPATLGRTAAIGVALPGHQLMFGPWNVTAGALSGSPDELAAA